jgi:phospholipid transport system substrate-binding protein
MKRFLGVWSTIMLIAWASGAFAAAMEPSDIVRNTTDKVLERIQSERDALRADPGKMYNLVAEMIFPHFDFGIMSQWVLGKHWNEADDATRENFLEQFRRLLVRTYATALLNFSDQSITYPPIDQKGGANTAMVKQQITQPGATTIPVIYRLHNKLGDWKVFDVSVDGVSLIKTYRASFGSIIKNGGLNALIDSLNAKNRQYSN